MAHFICRVPQKDENMSAEERIEALENALFELIDTLKYVLSHIDGDNLSEEIIEKIENNRGG